MSEKREPTFFDWKESETLYCTSIEDCVEDFLEQVDIDSIPETLEITGYAPMIPDIERIASWILDDLLETKLDDEYGNADGDYTKPTEAMKMASVNFVNEVLKEYKIWTCEPVSKQTVKISDYAGDKK